MCQHEEADRKDRARKDAAKSQEKVTGPAQEPDPLLSDFAKALEEHRESIPVVIMDHIDQLQRQIDFSRGGKYGPASDVLTVNITGEMMEEAYKAISSYINLDRLGLHGSVIVLPILEALQTASTSDIQFLTPEGDH